MKSFHFLQVGTITLGSDNVLTSLQQLRLGTNDSEPISSVSLTSRDFYRGFDKLKFVHEAEKRTTGRAYGMDQQFSSFIARDSFDGYLNSELELLLISAGKQKVNGVIRRLKKAYPQGFDVKRYTVDFTNIIEVVTNVRGSWISELPDTNVRSVGLFGDHVNLSADFSRHTAVGNLSALNVILQLDNQDVSFMITKDCTIVLYQDQSIEEELDLTLALWKLFAENDAIKPVE